ncbi:MAG: sugar kinase [bacterium]|nr:sugar kinase [bacterium]
MKYERIILVRAKTYLEELVDRFNSKEQAKFYLERSGRNFSEIVEEHETFYRSLNQIRKILTLVDHHKIIDKSFLPNYIFSESDLIIGIGQDGLIANIAKYANGQPIIGINPNPHIYDGVLLPFQNMSEKVAKKIINGDFDNRSVVMARAEFNDGQSLLAFNDFFIGPKSHTSAVYNIHYDNTEEIQSSSGIIVSTGIGSTGWLSSINNMVSSFGGGLNALELNPGIEKLFFVVREPFISKSSKATVTHGIISTQQPLVVHSKMVDKGILFSDGIESDFISFNIGTKVEIRPAKERANLVLVPS